MKTYEMARSLKKSRGFTLIEVIIAAAVLGIMAVPVFNCLNFCMASNIRSKVNSTAASTAQSIMEYYKGIGYHEIDYIIEGAGGASVGSCTVYYFLNDGDMLNFSKIPEGFKRCHSGEGREGFDEMDGMAALKGICYKYAVKVILSKENNDIDSGRFAMIDVALWCKNDKYIKNIELVSLKGE